MLEVSKKQRWLILVGLLTLIALIQILPQVDLPDVAFRRNQTPIVVAFLLFLTAVLAPWVSANEGKVEGLLCSERCQFGELHCTPDDCLLILLSIFRC